MIKLDAEYFIDADENSFVLNKVNIAQKGNNIGAERATPVAYCSTLESALNSYTKRRIRKVVSENDTTIKEVLFAIRQIRDDIDAIVNGEHI